MQTAPTPPPSPSTANAERFEKVIPVSTLVNDSNKDFCRIVLEAIKDPKNPICKRSIMKNGFSFFVDVECYDDGFVSKVSLFTEETKIHGILTAYGNKRYLPTDQSDVYEVKTGSHSFKTPSELKEFSVAFDLMHTILECLKNADFISTSTEAFDETLSAKVEELTKDASQNLLKNEQIPIRINA